MAKQANPAAQTQAQAQALLELPQLTPCVAKCGFYGSVDKMGLCSKCYLVLERDAKRLKDADAISFLLAETGRKSIEDVKVAVAFRRQFPEAQQSSLDGGLRLPGVRAWRTVLHPVSQFDEIPERGSSACTFIATFAALRCVLRDELPTDVNWADSIVRGVTAYHAAKRELPAGSNMHRSTPEVLEFLLPLLNMRASAADFFRQCFRETVVSLVTIPGFEGLDARAVLGETANPTMGHEALLEVFHSIFHDGLGAAGAGGPSPDTVAMVVIRPPESWFICKGHGPRLYFRDSHRRVQLDFDDLASFLNWLRVEHSYFVPMPALPHTMNEIALYVIVQTPALLVQDAMSDLFSA